MKLTSLATFMVASSFCIANFSLLNGGLKENKPTTIAYDCSFDPGEGSDEGIKIVTVEDGKRVSAPSFTFKDGYAFSYWWYIDPNEEFDFNTPIHEAMDFSASYVVEGTPVTHNITYVLNGGSFNVSYSAPLTYVEGVYLALPNETNLSKLNYTFDGWYKSSDLSGERYTGIGTNNTLDLTFYAKWKEIEATSYSVIFNSNGGTINSGLINSYKEGSETILPSDVTRDGYIFEWMVFK
jgi:uncharacterized repeat protein (TIGR02543 family)